MSEEKDQKHADGEKKDRIIDTTKRVKMVALKGAPYHAEGEEFEASPVLAEKMLKNKWARKADKE